MARFTDCDAGPLFTSLKSNPRKRWESRRSPACLGMPAPNQGRTAIKLHRIKLQKCPHPMPEKTPRPKTAKLPLKSPSPLPGSRGNQMEKVHGKSEERYRNWLTKYVCQRPCTALPCKESV